VVLDRRNSPRPRRTATAEPVPDEEQPALAIVLKDGSVQSAVVVSVQDDVLQYVDPDGEHRAVPWLR